MPSTEARSPVVVTGAKAGLLQSQPVRGGTGGITKVVHHQNFQSGGHLVGLSVATHQPGAACDEHNHRGADEQFYVLGGFGTITVNGECHYVQAGDSVLVPAGAMHKVEAAPVEDEERLPISRKPFVVQCLLIRAPGQKTTQHHGWAPTPNHQRWATYYRPQIHLFGGGSHH